MDNKNLATAAIQEIMNKEGAKQVASDTEAVKLFKKYKDADKKRKPLSKKVMQDYEELSDDKDMSLPLERFYAEALNDEESKAVARFYNNINYEQSKNSTTNQIYVFTNENLTNFFKNVGKIDRVATVGSSGDQAIYSIYKGAKEVDLIDLNIMTKVFVDLKIAAIRALTFSEFRKFMLSFPECLYNDKGVCYYQKFSHLLPKDSQIFWDTILLNGEGMTQLYWIFQDICDIKNDINLCEFYRSKQCYEKLQEILNKQDYQINFITAEYEDFPQKLSGEYDLIMFSNIFDYFYEKSGDYSKTPSQFLSVAEQVFEKHVKPGGMIQLTSNWSDTIYNDRIRALFSHMANKNNGTAHKFENSGLMEETAFVIQKNEDHIMNK